MTAGLAEIAFQCRIDLIFDVGLDLISNRAVRQSGDVDRDIGVDPFRKCHKAQRVVGDVQSNLEFDANAEVSEVDIGKILGVQFDGAARLEMEDGFQRHRLPADQI